VHLDLGPFLSRGFKGEDWKLHNTHNRLSDRHGIPPVRIENALAFISSSANSLLKQFLATGVRVMTPMSLQGCASLILNTLAINDYRQECIFSVMF